MLALSGYGDRRLSAALSRHVPSEATPGPGGLLGLELEFSVRSQVGGRVHFGSLIHRLALDGSALDPGDPNAYRCSWGGVITSDGAEAEISTPPVWTRPGFTGELQAWAETGEAALRRAVPRGIGLDGYSAHLSAAMPAGLNDSVCRLYAETFAVDLMLLTDRADSPGLLVRPRPGRTELCGEFIEGQTLPAAAAFVAGTTRACALAVRRRRARALLPPRLDVQLAWGVHRYGWYVDRSAFGTDLHAGSRRVLLPRASGGTISAQSHLELAWAAARQALADAVAVSDMRAAEAMVTGSLPLPAEHGQPGGPPGGQPSRDIRSPTGGGTLPNAPAPRMCGHVRPGFTLRPVAATWDFTVFEANGPVRRAYACVPRNSLPGFIDELGAGALDDAIAAYLARPSRRRVLSAHRQTRHLGFYDQMGAPAGLLAPERDPQTGHRESGRTAKHAIARPGKRNRQERRAPKSAPRFARKAAAIGAGVAVLLVAGGVAAAVLRSGPGGPNGGPPAQVSFQPAALSFPPVPISTSVARSVRVTNNGRSPVMITRIRIAGLDRGDFAVRLHGTLGSAHRIGQAIQPAVQRPSCLRRLPPGVTCKIKVVFTPSAPGPRTADLRIHFASRPQPDNVALTGTGIGGTPPTTPVTTPTTPVTTSPPPAAAQPPAVTPAAFGQVDLGQGPVSQSVTVRNPNPKPLTVTSAGVTGDPAFTVATDNCSGVTIPPGGSCFVTVQFAPTALGDHAADLTVATTATKASLGTLTGTGVWDLTLTVDGPGSVDDGQGHICAPASGSSGPASCTVPVTTPDITLTETPDSTGCAYGCYFQVWGGACSGTGTTCTLTITADTAVDATFQSRIG